MNNKPATILAGFAVLFILYATVQVQHERTDSNNTEAIIVSMAKAKADSDREMVKARNAAAKADSEAERTTEYRIAYCVINDDACNVGAMVKPEPARVTVAYRYIGRVSFNGYGLGYGREELP